MYSPFISQEGCSLASLVYHIYMYVDLLEVGGEHLTFLVTIMPPEKLVLKSICIQLTPRSSARNCVGVITQYAVIIHVYTSLMAVQLAFYL